MVEETLDVFSDEYSYLDSEDDWLNPSRGWYPPHVKNLDINEWLMEPFLVNIPRGISGGATITKRTLNHYRIQRATVTKQQTVPNSDDISPIHHILQNNHHHQHINHGTITKQLINNHNHESRPSSSSSSGSSRIPGMNSNHSKSMETFANLFIRPKRDSSAQRTIPEPVSYSNTRHGSLTNGNGIKNGLSTLKYPSAHNSFGDLHNPSSGQVSGAVPKIYPPMNYTHLNHISSGTGMASSQSSLTRNQTFTRKRINGTGTITIKRTNRS